MANDTYEAPAITVIGTLHDLTLDHQPKHKGVRGS